LDEKSGAVVTEVAPDSPAAQAGLQPGDVITHVNHHRVGTADAADQALAKADLKTGVQLQVENRQGQELVFVKPS
jgi:S1-C subfamily serine protease